jgi:YebC/PmpR family DNA-binding regulatory protein
MSGHSRWAGIKHKKAAIDSKKGKVFTKIAREITVATREGGGGNPEHNPRLRKAILDSREANMPSDNVKKAIQRGTGEIPGVIYEELRYEGYGPGGVAILVDCVTDNKNRTGPEIRMIFDDHGGRVAEAGAVGWMFHAKGYIAVEKNKVNEDVLLSMALDAGADDMKTDDDEVFEIFTAPADFEKVKTALEGHKVPMVSAELSLLCQTDVTVQGPDAEKVFKLINDLEDNEDVKTVHSNADFPKEVLEKLNA